MGCAAALAAAARSRCAAALAVACAVGGGLQRREEHITAAGWGLLRSPAGTTGWCRCSHRAQRRRRKLHRAACFCCHCCCVRQWGCRRATPPAAVWGHHPGCCWRHTALLLLLLVVAVVAGGGGGLCACPTAAPCGCRRTCLLNTSDAAAESRGLDRGVHPTLQKNIKQSRTSTVTIE